MKKFICVRTIRIDVVFNKHIIQVIANDRLSALLRRDTKAVTFELVHSIKHEYAAMFKQNLRITDKSMVVEIWGHVLADDIAKAMKIRLTQSFFQTISDKVISRTEKIDIGEKQVDGNRFAWDFLSFFLPAIAAFLPK